MIYAPSLKFSGAKQVAQSVIRALGQHPDVGRVDALVPAGRSYDHLATQKVRLHLVPRALQLAPAVLIWESMLRRLAARLRPYAVINLANIAVSGVDRQFVLLHWPHAVYMSSDVARRLSFTENIVARLKRASFRKRLRHAQKYFVQTDDMRTQLLQQYGVPAKIMENSIDIRSAVSAGRIERDDSRFRILVFSHFYRHKNLEIIEPLAGRVAQCGLPFVFVLTVDPGASRAGAKFFDRLRWAIEAGLVENRGLVSASEIPALYARSDALFLPTLLEASSTTYLEAMHFGVPIVTSDRGFARSSCGEAALYVDPFSVDDILKALKALRESAELRSRLVAAGRQKRAAQPSWKEIVDRLLADIAEELEQPRRLVQSEPASKAPPIART